MPSVGTHVGPVQPGAGVPIVVGEFPKYHLKPVAVGYPSEPLASGWPDRTCVDRSLAAGTFQFRVKRLAPALPRALFASNANVRAFEVPGAGAAVKSAVPPAKAPFVVTEVQQPEPLLGLVPPT